MGDDVNFEALGRYEYAKECIAKGLADRKELCAKLSSIVSDSELWNAEVQFDAGKIRAILEEIKLVEASLEIAVNNMNSAAGILGRKPYKARPL